MTGLDRELRGIPLRHGIAHADCVKSYVGLLCTAKSDFDAIENKRNDTFFMTALGIERVPSAPSLRQRFDEHAEAMIACVDAASIAFIAATQAPVTPNALCTGHQVTDPGSGLVPPTPTDPDGCRCAEAAIGCDGDDRDRACTGARAAGCPYC
jgi:hypothetical protein